MLWDALGTLWHTLETLSGGTLGRSEDTLGTFWGALWTLWGWMDVADDGSGDDADDDEDLRL